MDISTRLLPQFAYSSNPYMAAVMARMNANWGFPDPYYPASPVGMFSYSSDLATQYVTGFPPYIYFPTFWGSFRTLFIADPRSKVPSIPYATTSEVIHNSSITLVDAFVRNTLVLGSALATIGGALLLEKPLRGIIYGIGNRVPLAGSILEVLEAGTDLLVGESGLLTRSLRFLSDIPVVGNVFLKTSSWLASKTGSSVLRFLVGSIAGLLVAEQLGSFTLGNFVIDPIATTIKDTQRIRSSLGRLMIGSEEWNPATGTIRSYTAHEIFKEINRIWASEITVEYEDIMAILTAGSQLGLFDPIGPNKDRIIQAIKTIASHLRVISEIARDPSMVDTLRNLSALAQIGVSVEMAPFVYKQLAITSTAYGRPFSQIFPILQQEYGQLFMQLGFSPYTGIVVGNEALLYGTVMNTVLRERGMHLFVSALGNAEGIARMNSMLFGQLLKSDPLTQYMIISSSFGVLDRLDFGKSLDARTFFMYQLFDEEIAQRIVEEYGGAQWFNLHRGLLLNKFLEKTIKDPFTRAYVLRELGAPPELARAVATGDFSFYIDTLERLDIRKHQAELSAALNEMELRTYGILGSISLFFRKLKTWPRKFWADFIGNIKEDIENLRLKVRLGMTENPILKKLGELVWGTLQAGKGSLIGLQSKYFGTNVTIDEETIMEILEMPEVFFKDIIASEAERDVVESFVTGEYKRIKLFNAPTDEIRNRISFVAKIEEGFREKVRRLDSPLEVIRFIQTHYGEELRKYDRVTQSDIIAYSLTVWREEKGLTDEEVDKYVQKDLSRLTVDDLIIYRADIERYLMKKVDVDLENISSVGTFGEFAFLGDYIGYGAGIISPEVVKVFKVIKSDISKVLESGQFENTTFTEEDYKYISAYLEEKASNNKKLSSEAVKGYELLREKVGLERHLTPGEAAILYDYTDKGKLFGQLSSYDKVKEKEEILRRLPGAIPFSFGLQDLHKISQEYFVKEFMESGAREAYFDLIRTYHEAVKDSKITPEEREEITERVTRIKSFMTEVAKNAPEDLRKRLLELVDIQDPVEFSRQIYQGFMVGIKGDIGIQEKVGLVNTLRALADVSGTLEKNFRLLNDAMSGLLKKLGYSPYGINVVGK